MKPHYIEQSSKSSDQQHRPSPKPSRRTQKETQPKGSFEVLSHPNVSESPKTMVAVKSIINNEKTHYQICIANPQKDRHSDLSFTSSNLKNKNKFVLVKRYSELLEFYELLKKRYNTILIPHFPGKQSGRNSLDLVEHRRKKIERFFFNLFNLKHSNFSKKKIKDIIGTIGTVSFKKSLTGNLKGISNYFTGAVKNYIYDKLDKKSIVQVYSDLRRLNENEQVLKSVLLFIENEARLFLSLDEKYFRFATILIHFFSDKSVKEKNNLLESLKAFQEVEFLKQHAKNVNVEQLDQSIYQEKCFKLGPLKSSNNFDSGTSSSDKNINEIPADSLLNKTSKKKTQSFSQISALYFSANPINLHKRREREEYLRENGDNELMDVFKHTMSKIQKFLDLGFEAQCEIEEIGSVSETVFDFLRNALDKDDLKNMLNTAKTEEVDLPQVFHKRWDILVITFFG